MRLLRFIFAHSFFAALCAAALCVQTVQLAGGRHDVSLYGFVFAATICSYNFHLLLGAFFMPRRSHYPLPAALLVLLSAAVAAYLLQYLWQLLPWIGIALAANLLYSLPLLPWLKKIRSFGFAKTLLLAVTWTWVTALLPLLREPPVSLSGWLFALHRCCFMLQLCLIFDLRDAAVDKVNGLHSLATDISPAAATRLFYLLAAAFTLLTLLPGQNLSVPVAAAFVVVQAAALLLYHAPQRFRTYFFYFFLVDGLMILSALLTGLAAI